MYSSEIALERSATSPTEQRTRLVVGIPSMGRKWILAAVVRYIARQTRLPDELIVCVSSPADYEAESLMGAPFPVRVLISTPGSCRQRNHILDNVPDADIVVFLDDDFLMEKSYLERTERLFRENPDIVVSTGKVLADGIIGPGISFDDGIRLLNERAKGIPEVGAHDPVYNAYGCNMAVRMSAVRQGMVRFDEKLPLYGWLEDVDFSRLVAPYGRVVSARDLLGVHLGIKVARSVGVRLGYSQIANPIYLMRKKTMSRRHAATQMARNSLANLLRVWRPEPWVDRKGRLRGNLRAFLDLLGGRLDPANVEKL